MTVFCSMVDCGHMICINQLSELLCYLLSSQKQTIVIFMNWRNVFSSSFSATLCRLYVSLNKCPPNGAPAILCTRLHYI